MTILLLLAELIENDIDVALYEKTTCIWATKNIMAIRSQRSATPKNCMMMPVRKSAHEVVFQKVCLERIHSSL